MRRPGFSLIETLVVLGLIALFILVSFPVLNIFRQNLSLIYASRQVASDLRAYQQEAFMRQESVSIAFAGQAYSVGLKKVSLPAGVKVSRSKTISFGSTGFPVPGGSGTVILGGRHSKARKIIVSSSGRIRVE